MTSTRLVPITEAQRNALAGISGTTPAPGKYAVNQVIHAWDAAPPDPTEAVAAVLRYEVIMTRPDSVRGANAVLVALGYPGEEAS